MYKFNMLAQETSWMTLLTFWSIILRMIHQNFKLR